VIKFNTTIQRFAKQGEKTGWSYIEISVRQASQLKPGSKVSFRVKGKLDSYAIKQVALLPMGEGAFIIPFNADMRKGTGKKHGDKVVVQLEEDKAAFQMSADFMACLEDEPSAIKFFKTLSGSHQRYFSKWIDSAKTDSTKAKRIAMAVNALARSMGYPEMMREGKSINQ
jgi:Domain of unknown function (DUF1905)/Bacteriocin-protection, YdeI or OmpD-Associated